jgi:hypothetical protein
MLFHDRFGSATAEPAATNGSTGALVGEVLPFPSVTA